MKRLLAALLALPTTALAGQLQPSTLLRQIEQHGAQSVSAKMDRGEWGQVLSGIESGKREWLMVAVAIKPATDAGPSEMLSLAGGIALGKAPANVLNIMVPTHPIDGICGYPDMSDEKTDTQDKVLAYLRERVHVVQQLKKKGLEAVRDQCLKVLADTQREVLSPSGPFGK
jgi:hypothetical protein